MNTIIASKKKFYQAQKEHSSDTSIKKLSPNNIIINKPEKPDKNNNNDITNSYQETINSFERCQKCAKYEKEIESLVSIKSDFEKKYNDEKSKNNLLEKKYKTETTLSYNELNSTISSLRQDIMKKDVEIKHLQEKAEEYRNKYNQTLTEIETEKNNFIKTSEEKNNQKSEEINNLMNVKHTQMLEYAKHNTELIGQINYLNDIKIKLEQENMKLKSENDNCKIMINKLNLINNELKCDKNVMISEIEKYKRELGIIKENLDNKIKENNENFKKNELLKQDSSKNLIIAVNKQQELIETENNFFKLKQENDKLKSTIEELNNNINYMKNAKNVNDLLIKKQMGENKTLIQENNELKKRIQFIEQEYNKIKKMPKKDLLSENDLKNKNNILENENINQLDEINKLITQNEFLKNYYFNHEKEILNQKNSDELKNISNQKVTNNTNADIKNNNNIVNNNYIEEIKDYMEQKINLEKQIESYKNIITQLTQEKAILSNQLLTKSIHENELMLRIQEMENEEINNKKELIQKNIQNTELEEENIENKTSNEKLNKEIERKKMMNKSCVVANNSLKKINDDNQRQILNLNSEIIVLEKYNRDKEEYIKELNEENSKQKNEILKLKKNNDVLYKIIYKNNNNINI
jgi:hypothetical protein